MAKAVRVGQVAEWFKATVLKTHAVRGAKARNPRISNTYKPRMTRTERSSQRFAMAQMSAHKWRAGKSRQRPPALATNAMECDMADDTHKVCTTCKQSLPHENFGSRDGLPLRRCRACLNAYLAAYRENRWRQTPERNTWDAMKRRCLNPNHSSYSNYGGRGITLCKRWMKFANFYADMGPRPAGHSIDRIDNDKGYYKENCRWATAYEQASNKRVRRDSKVGMRGISFDSRTMKWRARGMYRGEERDLYFGPSEASAIAARKAFEQSVRSAEMREALPNHTAFLPHSNQHQGEEK